MRPSTPAATPQVRTYRTRRHVVVELNGEIDISVAPSVSFHLDAATARPNGAVLVDLTPVEFFDPYSLRLLLRARRRVLERGGHLLVVCPHPLILRMFRATGLDSVLDPAPTVDAAFERDACADALPA